MKTILSVSKAIHILNFIAKNNGKKNLTEISKALDISIGTLHGFIATLEQEKMIEKDPATGKYILGEQIFKYSLINDKGNSLARICKPYMEDLRDLTNETVHLALPVENENILYIEKSESTLPFRLTSLVGTVDTAENAAFGYLLYPRLKTLENPSIEFQTHEQREYCLKYEAFMDAYCIGTTFRYSPDGRCAGLSLVVPKFRLSTNTKMFYIEPFIAAADHMEQYLLSL